MTIRPWVKSYPPDVRWDAPLDLSSVQSVLEKAAERFGPSRRSISWASAQPTRSSTRSRTAPRPASRSLASARACMSASILPNTPHYVIAFFGVLKAGGVVVNYSPLDALPTLQFKVEDSETDILVTLDVAACLSAGREAARFHPPENADRRRIRRDDVRARSGQGADDSRRNAGGGQARRAPYRVPRSDRQRRRAIRSTRSARSPTRSPSCNTPAARPARRRARC